MKVELRHTKDGHYKRYEVSLVDVSHGTYAVRTEYGKIGAAQVAALGTTSYPYEQAREIAEDTARKKIAKGYEVVYREENGSVLIDLLDQQVDQSVAAPVAAAPAVNVGDLQAKLAAQLQGLNK